MFANRNYLTKINRTLFVSSLLFNSDIITTILYKFMYIHWRPIKCFNSFSVPLKYYNIPLGTLSDVRLLFDDTISVHVYLLKSLVYIFIVPH